MGWARAGTEHFPGQRTDNANTDKKHTHSQTNTNRERQQPDATVAALCSGEILMDVLLVLGCARQHERKRDFSLLLSAFPRGDASTHAQAYAYWEQSPRWFAPLN